VKRDDYEFLIGKGEVLQRAFHEAVDTVEGVDTGQESVQIMKLAEARLEGFFDGVFAASRDSVLRDFVRNDLTFRSNRDRILDLS
jgi:hypothetical protein